MPEEETEGIENTNEQGESLGSFFGPEGIIMMLAAVTVDVAELLPFIGPIISPLTDTFGLLFLGGWMLMRSKSVRVTQKTAVRMGKAAKWAKRMKWLRPLCFILEFIPVVGILPLWTLIVYLELKNA